MTRIGASGHQDLPGEGLEYVTTRLRDLLLRTSEDLVGICSLAVGTDQLFARTVLQAGGQLHIVVPSSGYRTAFSRETVRAYDELLSAASSWETLSFEAPSEEAFLAAGQRVVENSDLLVAVWDGKPARGRGGTGDVVSYARDHDVEVVVIWPEGVSR